MAALSDYLESGLLHHIFFGEEFVRPTNISIALTSGVPKDNDTGATLAELPSGTTKGSDFVSTGYTRVSLGNSSVGNTIWNRAGVDDVTGYQVNSTITSHSGYFYPLYLKQSVALAASTASSAATTTLTFDQIYPGVTFYRPDGVGTSGDYSASDPGYTSYEGNGFIQNIGAITFGTAISDWGWVSGVAITDSGVPGEGNVLMMAALENPRLIYTGDSIKFDARSLEISLK